MQDPVLRPSDATNLAGQDTGREHLSHTSIGTQQACLRRWELHYEERLELQAAPRALGLGRAFAMGREAGDPAVAVKALREEFDSTPGLDPHVFAVEASTVAGAVGAYLTRWPTHAGETQEFEYRVRLRNPWTGAYSNTFDLLGRADGLIDHGGYFELVEDKFVGRVDSFKVQRLPLDRQVALARYGIWRATGKPVRTVSYRWTKKPSIKQRQNEDLTAFCERLTADYAERVDFYTHEEQMFVGTDDLLRIEQELWIFADELRAARRRKLFPRNTASCADFGGCKYIPICLGDEDALALYRRREPAQTKENA